MNTAEPEACHGSRLRDDVAAPKPTESGVPGCECASVYMRLSATATQDRMQCHRSRIAATHSLFDMMGERKCHH